MVNSYLLDVLGKQSLDKSPWAMNHASVTPTDEGFLLARKNEFKLYLTTPRMLLGVDVSNLQQVVMLRPPNMEHAIVQVELKFKSTIFEKHCGDSKYYTFKCTQAMGRAGRITASGERTRTLMYILFNSQDIGRVAIGVFKIINSNEVLPYCRPIINFLLFYRPIIDKLSTQKQEICKILKIIDLLTYYQFLKQQNRLSTNGRYYRPLWPPCIGRNVRGMTDAVRQLCLSTDTCLRGILKNSFVGEYAASAIASAGFCCSVCDKSG